MRFGWRDNAMAASKITSISTTIAPNDPMSEPDAPIQKSPYCWHTGNQFVELLPLCAKYTIDAAADAPEVRRANMIFKTFLEC